jgi:hypothetical protein
VTRILLAGLAVCWLAVGAAAWRRRRRDGARRGPVRWHRAVATLSGWAPDTGELPVAAAWCRPVVGAVPLSALPRQRAAADLGTDERAPAGSAAV